MVFSSVIFLCLFLPITLLVYYIIPDKWRNWKNYWLLLTSLVFYAWNRPEFLKIILASILINYASTVMVSGETNARYKKTYLIGAVTANLLMLFYFKYFDFAIESFRRITGAQIDLVGIVLPIGISFFTFQGLSYVVDVYWGNAGVQKNIFSLGLYISMFPQLIAGPIVRYTDIEKEIDERHVSVDEFAAGIRRFSVGLGKKAILANALAGTADSIWAVMPNTGRASIAWLGLLAYSLQIYFDFSGYSDMAIGMGKMFGFHFMENFHFPYISRSVTEFWRRWHISLSTWFRDYVYIPLGGNRKHLYRNLIIVFFLTGLWHGAATKFVLWGLWHGFFMLIERATRERALKFKESAPGKMLSWAYTMLVVMLGWVLFRSDRTMAALSYVKALFGLGDTTSLYAASWFLDHYTIAMLILGILFSTPLMSLLWKKASSRWYETLRLAAENTGALLLLAYSIIRVMSSSYNPFIYFQF